MRQFALTALLFVVGCTDTLQPAWAELESTLPPEPPLVVTIKAPVDRNGIPNPILMTGESKVFPISIDGGLNPLYECGTSAPLVAQAEPVQSGCKITGSAGDFEVFVDVYVRAWTKFQESADTLREVLIRKNWKKVTFVNIFGDYSSTGVETHRMPPVTDMGPGYRWAGGDINYNCSAMWLSLSPVPQLVGGKAEDGHTIHKLKFHFDNEIHYFYVGQLDGSNQLQFLPQQTWEVVRRMRTASTLSVELPWLGVGDVTFLWYVSGFTRLANYVCE